MLTVISCGTSKERYSEAELEALDVMVQKKEFRIESNFAYPQTTTALQSVLNSGILQPGSSAGAISLIGNYNFLSISKDSISSHLPYFGERQMMVNYGGRDGAITFNGLYEDFSAEKNNNSSYTINLIAKSNKEPFNVVINIFPNLKADMMLFGAGRMSIQYTGVVVTDKK